jgi:hypothetical protein
MDGRRPRTRLLVGRAVGENVSTAVALDDERDCGIYDVATLEHARNRGLATALIACHLQAAAGAAYLGRALEPRPSDVGKHLRPRNRVEVIELGANMALGGIHFRPSRLALAPGVQAARRNRGDQPGRTQKPRATGRSDHEDGDPSGAQRSCRDVLSVRNERVVPPRWLISRLLHQRPFDAVLRPARQV